MLKLFELKITWEDGEGYLTMSPVVVAKCAEEAATFVFNTYKFPVKPYVVIDEYDIEEGLIV